MPILASLKIAALAIAIAVASEPPSTRLHCRLYFGCVPIGRPAADSLPTDWSD
jgi:hypothetical protein